MRKNFPCRTGRFKQAFGKLFTGLAFGLGLLLAACGGNDDSATSSTPTPTPSPAPTPGPTPTPTPTPIAANAVVAYPSETTELKLYAGQSQQLTLSFRTSDGGSATVLALGLPAGGLPAGWSTGSNRNRCEQVDTDNVCQIALTYAPAAAEPSSVLTVPYSYRNNKGDPGTGSIAIAYRALAVNAATTALTPAGMVQGIVGKTSSVVLGFGTNDGSPATDLHVENDLALLPAGWASTSAGLDCASFGAGSPCRLALSYTPASAAPASALAISYGYKDSSGKQQSATANIDFSTTAPNTVGVSLNPAGVVRSRAGVSQQVTLTFAPSDSSPASGLRLTSNAGKLPAGWTLQAATLPCAKVDGNGGCTLTLSYAPVPDQPAGKLDVDYAYSDATGRELKGKTTIRYASHDYQVYTTDYGDNKGGELVGGVRQCELDSAGKLSGCVKVATAWPIFGASEIAIYGSHAYIGGFTSDFVSLPPRQVTVCNIADDNALVDCAGSGGSFDQLTGLQVSGLGAVVLSASKSSGLQLSICKLANDGGLDTPCGAVRPDNFPNMNPYAISSTDTRIYVAANDLKASQRVFTCLLVEAGVDCKGFDWGIPEGQRIERMSFGQPGDRPYLYLATSPLVDPQKSGGRVVKCSIDGDGIATDCAQGVVPQGLSDANLIQILDIYIVRNSAWLVVTRDGFNAKVYQCPINQKTGDLESCGDAGNVDGAIRTSGLAVR